MSQEGPMGFKGRLAIKTGSGALTWDTGASYQEFLREEITSENEIDISQGITGDRSQRSERDRAGVFLHGGWVHFHISPAELPLWLYWATGGTPTGGPTFTYPLATGLPAFGVVIDKVTTYEGKATSVFELRDAQLDTLVLHGIRRAHDGEGPAPPDFIALSARVFGKSSTAGDVTFPAGWALGSTEAYRPYEMADLTFNVLSANREIKEFKFVLANNLFQRRVNNLNPTAIYPTGFRQVLLQVRVPNDDDHSDLYDRYPSYGQGVLTLSNPTLYGAANGAYATTITMPSLRGPRNGPVIVHKSEIDLTAQWAARRVGTGDECTITNKAS